MKYRALRLTVISCAVAIAMTAIACQMGEDAIFLIPYGYQGRILIFYDRIDGQPPRYEDGVRVYEIPPNGVLFSQFSKTSRFANWTMFYQDEGGKRVKIPYIDEIDMVDFETKAPIDSEQVYVYRAGYGNALLNEGETLKNVAGYKPRDTVKTIGIVLSSPRNWDSIASLANSQHSQHSKLFDIAPYEGE